MPGHPDGFRQMKDPVSHILHGDFRNPELLYHLSSNTWLSDFPLLPRKSPPAPGFHLPEASKGAPVQSLFHEAPALILLRFAETLHFYVLQIHPEYKKMP